MSVKIKVKEIIAKQFGVEIEKVTPEVSIMEDLGGDSLDTIDLIMEFEKEFSIEIPDEDAGKMLKVQDVIRYIEDKTN